MLSVSVINSVVPGDPNTLPIGTLMIASVLRQAGFDVRFYDYQAVQTTSERIDPETFFKFISSIDDDILAIGTMTGNHPTVLPAIERLKRAEPDRIVILGGPGPTDTPREIMENWPIDYIVVGEGERTAVELLRAIRDKTPVTDVSGIWFRNGSDIVSTGARPRILDLDELPPPAYDLIDFSVYSNGLHIMTSRGCPYRCGFCSTHTIWGKEVVERDIGSVVREIESVKSQISWITFCDDNLALKPNRLRELCSELKENDLIMPWMAYGRINLTTEDLVKDMASAGCEEIFYGIESGSQSVLSRLQKKIDLKMVREIIRMTVEHVLQVNTSYIWGYPFESIDDFVETLLSVGDDERVDRVIPHLYLLGPFVNTPLYAEFSDRLKFSPDFVPNVGSVPMTNRIPNVPEVTQFIADYPKVAVSFHHYAHDELEEKRRIINSIMENRRGKSAPIGPAGRRSGSNHGHA